MLATAFFYFISMDALFSAIGLLVSELLELGGQPRARPAGDVVSACELQCQRAEGWKADIMHP